MSLEMALICLGVVLEPELGDLVKLTQGQRASRTLGKDNAEDMLVGRLHFFTEGQEVDDVPAADGFHCVRTWQAP